jgi:hypothetical protein
MMDWTLIDKLNAAYAFNGDPLHLKALQEIGRLHEALMHIAWGGIQSVDEAEKYARNTLESNKDVTMG